MKSVRRSKASLQARFSPLERQGQWIWSVVVAMGLATLLLVQFRPELPGARDSTRATASDDVRQMEQMISNVNQLNRKHTGLTKSQRLGPFEVEREF